jgi:hypothetical protein
MFRFGVSASLLCRNEAAVFDLRFRTEVSPMHAWPMSNRSSLLPNVHVMVTKTIALGGLHLYVEGPSRTDALTA